MDYDIHDKHFITKAYGGSSPCIEGNDAAGLRPFPGSVLPNCVGAATAVFNIIAGEPGCKYLGNRNAIDFTKWPALQGLKTGTEPKEGACMVWGHGEGHVAVVDKVISPTEVETVESGWSYRTTPVLRRIRRKKGDNGRWGYNYEFLMFIYPPGYTPTPPGPTPPAPTPPVRETYKIKWGDTLSRIAVKFHVTVQELCEWNHIANPNKIYAGNVIFVSPPLDPQFTEYAIRRGDTLSGIAKKFGTTIKQIMEDNPFIKDPNKIYAGDVLKIRRKS